MSTHDVADSLRRASRERVAIPAMVDALERVLNNDPDAWRWAAAALAAAGHPWDQQRYTMRKNLKK
jgi:hypothetical protein